MPEPDHGSATRRTRAALVALTLAALAVAAAAVGMRRMLLMSAPSCLSGRWHGCYDTENGVVLMTLLALPVAAAVAWGLTRRRRAAGVPDAARRSVAEVGLVHGTLPWLWLTLMPGAAAGTTNRSVVLVPLTDLPTWGTLGIVGNLLVFAPLGFFGPLRFAALASLPRVLALGAACSLVIETAQYVLRLDRVSSVDDVLVNATGALLAGLASRPWWRRRPDPVDSSAISTP
ncbi:MAG TPA: VanZ family protein [Kineosporiaceae bacterium]|jgi:hypothetical protein|nr:VanZ family protein [Kineosporiaceae bacterium]